MKLTQRVRNAVAGFAGQQPTQNSLRGNAADFLRYGNRSKPIIQDWSQVEMTDLDMYSGYGYAAINKRANRSVVLGKNFLYTKASDPIMTAAKQKDTKVEHPYLPLIYGSKEFTENDFWWEISRYLDLEGVYYLMAVRAVGQGRDGTAKVGATQKFVMLNPYEVRRVRKESDGTIGGYIEAHDGMYREIPKEMIIEIIYRNPVKRDDPYAMTDAAKDAQFTLKQAGDYARHSIKGNINSPGAITTDVVLEDHIFDNFISRIKNHDKGEPLYGNGAGSIKWESMQIDLDKAALDKINEIHRQILFAVSGTSKTTLGIEESGTTRDTSAVQKDNFTEDAVMPQVEKIIDALNLDYRKWYPEWEKNKYEIALDNPLESDRDAEIKDIEIRDTELDLRDKLVAKGYEYEVASKYAQGEISLDELGEPTLEEEISDEEATRQAALQLGIPLSQAMNPDQQEQQEQNNELAKNAFVAKGTNDKKIKAAAKRLKAEASERKKAEKAAKEAEKEAKAIAKDEENKKKLDEDAKSQAKDTQKTAKTDNQTIEKIENQISARDIPDLYDDMDIDMENLGCIMINTEKIPVLQYVKDGESDLIDATDRHDHTMGAVSEVEPHATLLYGLLENGNVWKNKVDKVLEGWSMPTVTIDKVDYFDLPESYAVIAKLVKTPEIVDGHERLTLLPHINTFSEYQPHITLAYISKEADVNNWVATLSKKYNGQIVATTGINYGDQPEDDGEDKTDNHVEDEHDMENLPKAKKKSKEANEKEELVENASQTSVEASISDIEHNHDHLDYSKVERAQNALEPAVKDTVMLNQGNLQNGILDIDQQMTNQILLEIQNGNVEPDSLWDKFKEKNYIEQLSTLLAAYYLVVLPIYAKQSIANRSDEFGQQGVFAMTTEINNYIKTSANKAADSHVNTIFGDITKALDNSLTEVTNQQLESVIWDKLTTRDPDYLKLFKDNPDINDVKKAIKKGKFDNDPAYALARQKALSGEGINSIIRAIQNEYSHISDTRAKTIARHESSRVFTMSQYQADLQFLKETNNLDRAYKRLISRSGNPCPICNQMIIQTNQSPIPFTENFANLHDEISATYKKENGKMGVTKLVVNYEPIAAGNVHVNCNCEYQLVLQGANGKWINTLNQKSDIIDTEETK